MKELFLTILLRGALGGGRKGFRAPPAACHTIQDKHLLLFHQSTLRCAGSGPCLFAVEELGIKVPHCSLKTRRKKKKLPLFLEGPAPSPCPAVKLRGVKRKDGKPHTKS